MSAVRSAFGTQRRSLGPSNTSGAAGRQQRAGRPGVRHPPGRQGRPGDASTAPRATSVSARTGGRAWQLEDDKRLQEEEAEAARRAAVAPDVLRHALLRTLARTSLLNSLTADEQAGGRLRLQPDLLVPARSEAVLHGVRWLAPPVGSAEARTPGLPVRP